MAISEMIKTLVSEAVEKGDVAALNYIEDRVQADIDEMVEDGPVFANEAWAQGKREELRVALEAARIEITRENATPFGAVYATLDDAIQHMKTARTAYMRWTERDNEIEQAHDAVTRAIALLKDIERTAEEAN